MYLHIILKKNQQVKALKNTEAAIEIVCTIALNNNKIIITIRINKQNVYYLYQDYMIYDDDKINYSCFVFICTLWFTSSNE